MKKFAAFILILIATACVPKRKEMDFSARDPVPPNFAKPDFEDQIPRVIYKGERRYEIGYMKTSDLLLMAENIRQLAVVFPQLNMLMDSLDARIRLEMNKSFRDVKESAYFSLLIKEAVPQVNQAVSGITKELRTDVKGLERVFLKIKLALRPGMKISELGALVDDGFNRLLRAIEAKQLNVTLKENLLREMTEERAKYADLFNDLVNIDKNSTTLGGYASSLSARLEQLGLDESQKELRKAARLGTKVDNIKDAQSALAAIIYAWGMLSKKERKNVIGGFSPELYEYLNGQDKKELDCLASDQCDSFFKVLAKQWSILPQIEKFGVAKIRGTINKSSLSYVRERLKGEIQKQLANFGTTVNTQVQQRVSENLRVVGEFGKSFGVELLAKLPPFLENSFSPAPAAHSALDNRNYAFNHSQDSFELEVYRGGVNPDSGVGSWLSYIAAKLSTPSTVTGSDRQYLFSALDYAARRHALRHEAPKNDYQYDYDVLERMEKLRGLSKLVLYTADWNASSYDQVLGGFRLFDVFTTMPKASLDHAIFPKNEAMLLMLSVMGQELKELDRTRPPLFIINADKSLEFIHTLYPSKTESVAVMAGLANVEKGVVNRTVRIESLARAILTLCDFLDNTAQLSTSNVPRLKVKDASGTTPLEQLERGRTELRKLLLGLSNLLSNHAISEKGLVATEFELTKTADILPTRPNLENQALTIKALVRSAKLTGLEIYTWDAIKLINILNTQYFDSNNDFYNLRTDQRGELFGVIEMLGAIEAIKPLLNHEEALKILERIERQQVRLISRVVIK